MPKIDVTDEAVIDAPPKVVYKEMLDLFAGLTHWRMPHFEAKTRKDSPIGGENMISDIIIRGPMGLDSRFTTKVMKVEEGKSIVIDVIGGDFIGTSMFTFESIDEKTHVSYRFAARPTKLLFNIISPLVRKSHSNHIQNGYKSLNQYLNKN